MSPEDPRHGTSAGHRAHQRAGQDPCPSCVIARSRADKRLRVYGANLEPLHPAAWRKVQATPRPALVAASGVSECAIRNMERKQGRLRVRPETNARLLAARPVTEVGLARRIKALNRLGWSLREIARDTGIHFDNLQRLRDRVDSRKYVQAVVRDAVLATYQRLQMTPAPTTRWSIVVVNRATRMGWPPPMAWDDIDDPAEVPSLGWKPVRNRPATELFAELDHLTSLGVSEWQAAKQLGVTVDAIEKARARAGRGAA